MHANPEIYLIDDDAGVRNALAFALLAADFKVRDFASAEEFLAVEPGLPAGCVITDLSLIHI